MTNFIHRFVLPPSAALLLDLENQGIMDSLEVILEKQAKYPVTTKIAVANFINRPKVGMKLHRRMYSMVHVPQATNAADAQIITTGCLLFLNNPKTKEVFICSNDQIFSSLQKTLIHLGKEVHIVKRKGNNLYIDNALLTDSSIVAPLPSSRPTSLPAQINTITELTESMMTLIVQLLQKDNAHAIKINRLGSKFAQIYGNGISYFLNQFKLGIKFVDFLKLNPDLTIIKQNKEYYVCLTQVSAKI